jgi:flagellar basal body rod protein FlgG
VKTDGMKSAAQAMRYWERRQEVAANNLANATTTGFKAERVFARLVENTAPAPEARTDWKEGALTATGNPFDFALRGHGFFVVQTPEGERWTRGGAWTVDPKGFLVDADGHQVLGEKGPIRPVPGDTAVDRYGRLPTKDGWDRLRVERAPVDANLEHQEGTRWVPADGKEVVALEQRDVRQGHLEGSNVNTVSSLVDLIAIQRNYAFAQRALTTLDQVRATISNELGKPNG